MELRCGTNHPDASFSRSLSAAASLLVVLLGFASCVPAGQSSAPNAPRVVNGVIDLRDWDFERDGPVELDGDWDFYWRRLVPPAAFAQASARSDLESDDTGLPGATRMAVPGKWNGRILDGAVLGGDGFATYRLRILMDPERLRQAGNGAIYALRFRRIYTAYRLYANGSEIVSVGVVARTAAEATPDYRIILQTLVVNEPILDLVLHISNHHHLRGGIPTSLFFGTEANIRGEREARLAFDLFLIGGLLILGISQLGLYLLSRVERAPVMLGVFCLIIAFRHLIDDERYIDHISPDIPWHLLHRLTYATFAMAVILALEHFHRFFPREVTPWMTRPLQIVASGFLAITLVAAPKFYVAQSIFLEITAVLSGVYLIAVVAVAFVRRRNESVLFILSLLCLVPGMIYKILYDRGHWAGLDLLPLGLFGFVLTQTLAVSRRFSRSFISIEKSSRDLERRVAYRTRQLRSSRDQLAEARDRAEDSNRAKSEFLATMSHEIRTPLNAIIGTSELLRDGEISSAERESYVTVLNRAGKNLLRLINQVLDFSRLEEGQTRLARIPFAPAGLLSEVADILEIQARDRGLRIVREIEIEESSCFLGDPDRINQVLINLVGNAVKFAGAGGRVRVSLRLTEDPGGASTLRFEVEDDGPGIPEGRVEEIFERFTQVDSSDSRSFEGTGLGLAITKKLVDLMDGEVFHTTPDSGKGSCFIVLLPAPPFAPQSETPPPTTSETGVEAKSDAPVPGSQASPVRILLAEDNDDNRLLIRAFLKGDGYVLDLAADGLEAVEKFDTATGGDEAIVQYDLILMDIQMPRMDGYAATRKIRQLEAARQLSATPILALTANATSADVRRSEEAGCDAHLSKPILKDVLLSAVDRFVAR